MDGMLRHKDARDTALRAAGSVSSRRDGKALKAPCPGVDTPNKGIKSVNPFIPYNCHAMMSRDMCAHRNRGNSSDITL